MTTTYAPTRHTADEWRAMAQTSHERAVESFERSDTDGYLSQWASDTMGRLYSFLASLAEDDGMFTFASLADLDGNLIEGARLIQTQYGTSWLLPQADGSVQWFNPSRARKAAARVKNNAAKGFQFLDVRREALVSLSDAMIPTPYAFPARDGHFEVVGPTEERDY